MDNEDQKRNTAAIILIIVAIIGYISYTGIKEFLNDIDITSITPYQVSSENINGSASNLNDEFEELDDVIFSYGEKFRLGEGETAFSDDDEDLLITVNSFINSPCPEGAQCLWSGKAVSYELFTKDKIYHAPMGILPEDVPYEVKITDSDYKTYAEFVINKKQ